MAKQKAAAIAAIEPTTETAATPEQPEAAIAAAVPEARKTPTESRAEAVAEVPAKEAKEPEGKVVEAKEPETDIADELREAEAMNQLLGLPKAEKKDEKTGEETPAKAGKGAKSEKKEPEAKTPETPKTPDPEKKLKVKAVPEPRAGMTPEEVAQIATQTVAEYRKTEPKAAAEQEPDNIPDELKVHAPDYAQLEKLFPDKYKPGLLKRIAGFKQSELDYADKWEAANKGETFNADAPEHETFYAKNQPQIDPADLEEARFERRYQQRLERDVRPELDEVKRERALTKAEPMAQQAAMVVGEKLFRALNEDHKGPVTQEVIKTWADAEPTAAATSRTVAEEYLPVAYTASLLWDGVEKYDAAKPAHAMARDVFSKMETELASASPGELVNEQGQNWVPLAKYNTLPEAQRKKFYTTSKEALVNYVGLLAVDKVKKMHEETTANEQTKAEYYAKKFGYVKSPAQNGTPAAKEEAPEKPAAARSPSIGGGSPTTPSKGTASVEQAGQPNVIDGLLGLTQLGR